MGLFSFIKNAGKKIFSNKENDATPDEKPTLKASALLAYVKQLGLPYQNIKISLTGDDVILEGEVAQQSDAEKIALAVGNVEGVDTVDNRMRVTTPAAESQYHTVVAGDQKSPRNTTATKPNTESSLRPTNPCSRIRTKSIRDRC